MNERKIINWLFYCDCIVFNSGYDDFIILCFNMGGGGIINEKETL